MAVDETKRLPNHQDATDIKETLEKGFENVALALHAQAASGGSSTQVKSWAQIQQIVRSGLAPQVFSVGQQIEVEKASAVTGASSNSGLTVSVTPETFLAKMGHAENTYVEFLYDGSAWTRGGAPVDLVEYGVSVKGTPAVDDVVTIHETASKIVFDILGFDQETPADESRTHSMTLGMHSGFTQMEIGRSEALVYLPDGLPAGSYKITLESWAKGTWYFTLASAVSKGGYLRPTAAYNASTFENVRLYVFNDRKETWSSPAEKPLMSATEISGAYDLGTCLAAAFNSGSVTIDGATYKTVLNIPSYSYFARAVWETSCARQWCNSDKPKGGWWEPQFDTDIAPQELTSRDGFLYGLDPELVSVIGKVKKYTEYNPNGATSGNPWTVDKCFFLSGYELGVRNGVGVQQYKYFNMILNGNDNLTYGTIYRQLIKQNPSGKNVSWKLRSSMQGVPDDGRVVDSNGYLNYHVAGLWGDDWAVVALAII